MLKRNKKLILGIMIGVLISMVTPVGASINEYTLSKSDCKIVVDGVEVKGELPLLIMEPGFNYIPATEFRSICDKMGIGFEFDVPTKEIRINTKKDNLPIQTIGNGMNEGEKTVIDNKGEITLLPELHRGHKSYINVNMALKRQENNLTIYEIFGTEYIEIDVAKGVEGKRFHPVWEYDEKSDYGYINILDRNGTLLLEDIPFVWGGGLHYSVLIEYDYYLNTILPLISK
ncbi:MAG TPA: hypothetical protein GXZ70_04050 [Clostridiales bacterium]|nr:hypothetical protein [Clostridiales bacterium]